MFVSKFVNLLKSQKTLFALPKYNFNDSDDAYFRQSQFRRSYTKPFTITSDESILSINCVKGKFKQQQNYIALDKMGMIILDFIPLKNGTGENAKQYIDVKGKKNFTLNIKSVGEILKYNPYDLKNSDVKLEFKYYAGSLDEEKKLTIQKGTKEDKINFSLATQRGGNNSNFNIQVDAGDFLIMKELLRYSIPYMLGWHIMSSPRVAEEEFNSNMPAQSGDYN